MNYLGNTFIIEKPEAVPTAFWSESMNDYVGRTCTVVKEGISSWVHIDIDQELFMWNKEWLKPVSKLKKRTLREEMMDNDAKAAADIKRIKRDGFVRRRKIQEQSELRQRQIINDKTPELFDKFLQRNKSLREGTLAKNNHSTNKLPIIAVISLVGLLSFLTYIALF